MIQGNEHITRTLPVGRKIRTNNVAASRRPRYIHEQFQEHGIPPIVGK